MRWPKRNSLLLFILIICTSISLCAQEGNQTLWYNKPAEKWTDALPIGNGRLGAMIFAGVEDDHVQFNEETLWTGKPRDYNRKGASKYLPDIRKLLFEGKQKEAQTLAQAQFMGVQSEAGDREAWVKEMKAGKGILGNPASTNYDDRLWKNLKVTSYEGWEKVGLENLDGAVWFRTTIDVPKEWMGKDLILDLNKIFDQDFTYVNGFLVGQTAGAEARKYTIPAKVIEAGKNTIAVQVLNFYDRGGIGGYKDVTKKIGVYPIGSNIENGISLVKEWKYKIQNNAPPAVPQYQASYQPFGDLNLKFDYGKSQVSNYKRALDLTKAIAKTSYTVNGIDYQRTYLASQPNQAIIIHLTANKKASISFNAALSSVHQNSSVKVLNNHNILLFVQVKDGALRGESRLTAVIKNGVVKTVNNQIRIQKADEVTLYLTAGTNFINANDVSGDPTFAITKALNSLKGKTYADIEQKHIQEYQQYYNTFKVDFGRSENEKLPTDERLQQFATANDPGFVALYMQYGRYLLISSSRPGTQPANLQGIWNDLLAPPWGSKYTTNINLEMNYWPAEILNLSGLNEPLFEKIKGLSKSGTETAKEYYHAKGWVLHHNTDIWNGTAPINSSTHGIWVTGGAWLSQHLWEHYQFTQNQNFLKNEAYPLMKQTALFFEDFLLNGTAIFLFYLLLIFYLIIF